MANALAPAASRPDRANHLDEFGPALLRALERLPERQRDTFALRVWEGLDVRQTAHALGISQGSVKTHHSRALHALRLFQSLGIPCVNTYDVSLTCGDKILTAVALEDQQAGNHVIHKLPVV